jgi:hypothetical protein
MTAGISGKILARLHGLGRGSVFTPKDFLDLASHETVRQWLSRQAERGEIRRLRRGVYEHPEHSRLLDGPANPDPDAVARAIARAHGWTIVPTGDTALNLLGLSAQVPAQWQYFSDGPTRELAWSGGAIRFRRRANKESSALSPRTALLVQALKALGKERVDDVALARLDAAFGRKELARALREARYATGWVYEVIRRLAAAKEANHA